MDPRFYVTCSGLALCFLLEHFLPFYKREAHIRHAIPNFLMGVVSAVVTGVFIMFLCHVVLPICKTNMGLLYRWPLSPALRTLAVFLLLDCWMYWWHRFNHQHPFLWRFHRVHHADTQMDSSTAVLFHPIEIFISMLIRTLIIMAAGFDIMTLLYYDAIFIAVVIFHHSNISIPEALDKGLRILLLTPALHRVHHSIEKEELNSNFSSVFSFWDRLFRSFVTNTNTAGIRFGVDGIDPSVQPSVKRLLMLPFHN